jgi:hypothetical protein
VAASLVEEDEAARVEALGQLDEAAPQLLDTRRLLLGGGQGLFFA